MKLSLCAALCGLWTIAAAGELTALADSMRFDASGMVIEAGASPPSRSIELEGARGGYVSCQVAVKLARPGGYRLSVDAFPVASGLETDVYREWLHWVPAAKRHYPDALIPVRTPYSGTLPDPDNRVAGQTAQAFWIDVWIPERARPGAYAVTVRLIGDGTESSMPLRVRVLPGAIPADDAVAIDHNSYGTSWFSSQYPKLALAPGFYDSEQFYELIHAYHRLFYEHRGVFHQLGYGHGGKVGPEFAPRLEGSGKTRRIADWTAYDRHYGPLFDGSAFARTRRGLRPVPFAYLPVNPEWPASFLWWGEAGYEREFVNVMSAMEGHFREKGWTQTRLELFFNHKKRYKGFPWDGDEARFVRDYAYMKEYARLMRAAVPAGSPVKFVFRADVSWTMERQFRELAGVVDFWVCGGGMFSWYREALPALKQRGDIVWIYGGTPPVSEPLSHMATDPLRTWQMGVDGFVRWQTVDPGPDPWFQSNGGGETLVYPGDRFGVRGPLASIRLKAERNALQDLAVLKALGSREEAARRFNGTTPDEWWTARPAIADTDPDDWSNATIDDAEVRSPKFANIDADAWKRVREYTMRLAGEAH